MKKTYKKEFHHPFIIRLTHWINALSLGLMITSGLRIYNASPLFGFYFPDNLTLGGWLGGARQWHFFAMWIFVFNGLIYIFYNILSRHGRNTTLFRWKDISGIIPMIKYYLRIRKDHPPQKKYNSLQKLAYTFIPLAGLGSILTGMAIYWPVQLSFLTSLFGNYNTARVYHFVFTTAFVLFIIGHLLMVAIAGWYNFLSMITGWKKSVQFVSTEVPIAAGKS
jgi:thiosulfate reductase cytochrome b subunit